MLFWAMVFRFVFRLKIILVALLAAVLDMIVVGGVLGAIVATGNRDTTGAYYVYGIGYLVSLIPYSILVGVTWKYRMPFLFGYTILLIIFLTIFSVLNLMAAPQHEEARIFKFLFYWKWVSVVQLLVSLEMPWQLA